MAIAPKWLRGTRGNRLATVTSTIAIDLIGASPGDSVTFEVDHSAIAIEGEASIFGQFADNPMPVFDAEGAYRVQPVLDGTDGTKFRAICYYVGDPEVIFGFGDEYGSGSPPEEITLTWYRKGVLTDDAG